MDYTQQRLHGGPVVQSSFLNHDVAESDIFGLEGTRGICSSWPRVREFFELLATR